MSPPSVPHAYKGTQWRQNNNNFQDVYMLLLFLCLVANSRFSCSLEDLASYLLTNGPRKVLPAARRVRVIHNHATIVDTTKSFHVWEHDAYPQFYVPLTALRNCTHKDIQLVRSDGVARAAIVELTIPARAGVPEIKTNRVIRFTDDKSLGALSGLVRLEFGAMGMLFLLRFPCGFRLRRYCCSGFELTIVRGMSLL